MNDTCAVNFLDVGQGSSNIICYSDETRARRAIVIDCGRRSDVALQYLHDHVDFIDILALTHNDKDHVGGAAKLIADYAPSKQIGQIWHLTDREWDNIQIAEIIQYHMDRDELAPPRRLEDGALLFDAFGVQLKVLAPDYYWSEMNKGNPNRTSAILILTCGVNKILFTGDSDFALWEWLHQKMNSQPIQCEAVTVPHHGGLMAKSSPAGVRFFSDFVQARHAVVSVGTDNQYGHPRMDVVFAARKHNAVVLCTQITRQCCSEPERLIPGVIPPTIYSQSHMPRRTSSGRPVDIACAGSVSVVLTPTQAIWGNGGSDADVSGFESIKEFQSGVDRLVNNGHRPMCR